MPKAVWLAPRLEGNRVRPRSRFGNRTTTGNGYCLQ